MKTADVLRERMTRQGLATRVLGEAADAARIGVALQAQDLQASRLGVRARVTGTSEAAVATACGVERSVVRTWLMRSTVHLVPAADAQWMAALFGPMISRRFAKRWSELGLSAKVLDAAAAAVPEVLGGEALNRHELVAALRQLGIHVDPDGQAPSHLVLFTSTIGLTCRGPDRGRETTFVLAESWLPSSSTGLSGDEALANSPGGISRLSARPRVPTSRPGRGWRRDMPSRSSGTSYGRSTSRGGAAGRSVPSRACARCDCCLPSTTTCSATGIATNCSTRVCARTSTRAA